MTKIKVRRIFAIALVAILIMPIVAIATAVCKPAPASEELSTIDEIIYNSCINTNTATVDENIPEVPATEQISTTQSNELIYTDYSDSYDILARAIYQESGSCGEYCQWLVGSAILNLADERDGIENVVFDYNTINVAYALYDDTPSELSYWVAQQLLSGHRDYNVKYFRSEYYHSFGTPYTNVDNIYFSTS